MERTLEQCVCDLIRTKEVFYDNIKSSGFMQVRCPFCKDSRKNAKSAHLYVKVKVNEDERMWYKCQRCEEGGIVDSFLLDLLDLYDPDFSYLKGVRDTKISKLVGKKGYGLNKIKPIKLLPPLNNKITLEKIKYLEDRLGIKVTTQDILDLKIILNYYDFFNYNNIKDFTRKQFIMNGLDMDYIGFLTTRNEFINSRNIRSDNDKYLKRYINYNIYDLTDNTRKLYTISNKVDIMKKVKIILAEGIFDIIGIYNHIYNKQTNNKMIFAAVLGMGYASAIKYFMKLGFIFADYEIYSDGTVPLDTYRELKKQFGYKLRDSKMTICYNTLSKDCGVTADKIKIKQYII